MKGCFFPTKEGELKAVNYARKLKKEDPDNQILIYGVINFNKFISNVNGERKKSRKIAL